MATRSSTSRRLAPRTRGLGTLTEAQYWAKVRSALRQAFRYWPALKQARAADRVAPGRFRCAGCGGVFRDRGIEVDHVVPCGSLRCSADLAPFLDRLTPETVSAFQVLCGSCHQAKTGLDRLLA